MRRNSSVIGNSGAYTSPGTPDYGDNYGRGMTKGWSSERVPLPTNSSRRHISAAALMPFNSGRALPSKWDDAERWITSPISGYGVYKTSTLPPERRPKSKSGPLGTTGVMYMPNYSPTVPALEGGSGRNFLVGSPLTTGVLMPDALSVHYGAGNGGNAYNSVYAANANANANVSTLPGLSDFLEIKSLQNDKLESYQEAEGSVSRVVSRRDMATQMSPDSSIHSSPKARSSFSALPLPIPNTTEQHGYHSEKVEVVRDVQVDKGATVTRQSKKHGARKMRKKSSDSNDLVAQWDISGAAKTSSKLQREEAKIAAWENLQKAKAEAAIRKLEMKLEKKRSASMDKILNKLRAAQTKAQDMRSSISENQTRTTSSTISHKLIFRRCLKTNSLRGCFVCCT
ncbi:OLC1v1010153C1 [Oldenlandia corymbosa var. corymbosa]|uniref:OLC1v1010153C1 n=1 Tax=Oldenlandia corymbosa var. corymbosa TaxID=529605 RepID=A0AAV1DTN4_OLDCO|nr:OLC1v1010153C1 [Oldenlandia corymbosa var. corymbosa]